MSVQACFTITNVISWNKYVFVHREENINVDINSLSGVATKIYCHAVYCF